MTDAETYDEELNVEAEMRIWIAWARSITKQHAIESALERLKERERMRGLWVWEQ